MTALTPADRTAPAGDADERAMLVGWLDYHRVTLELKCAGLTDRQLKTASVPSSSLTLLGLMRHLTDVERYWFREVFDGEVGVVGYSSDEAPDDDFDALDSAPVDEVFARWRGEQAHAVKSSIARHRWTRRPAKPVTIRHPRCAGSWPTWSRSTPGTTGMRI